MSKPAPLTPPDSNLSDFGFMPLDVGRFRRSDLVTQEEPEAIVAAILLWGHAWHSTPAASLSKNDRSLAQAAGFGRAVEAFLKVKDAALRGFIECSDGRLYHPVVAEKAREAWKAKVRRLWRTECARIRKHNERHPDEKIEQPSFDEFVIERERHARQDANVTSDNADMSRATSADSHARHDEDAQIVTRDNFEPAPDHEPEIQEPAPLDERNKVSHATPPEKTRDRDLDSCARAEKGQGQGQGEGDSNRLRSASSKAEDDDFPDLEDEAPIAEPEPEPKPKPRDDRFSRVEILGRKAGLNLTRPQTLITATEQLKEWEEEGIDFETVILPTIERRTRENPSDPIFSLRYFDAAVRKAAAIAGDPKAAKPKGPPPKLPTVTTEDSDDERVGKFRRKVEYHAGKFLYERSLKHPAAAVRLIDDKYLDLIFPTDAQRSMVQQSELASHLIPAAQSLGLDVRLEIERRKA